MKRQGNGGHLSKFAERTSILAYMKIQCRPMKPTKTLLGSISESSLATARIVVVAFVVIIAIKIVAGMF
jgi:hypothetical protein